MLELSAGKKKETAFFLRMLAKILWAVGMITVMASCGTSPGYNYTISGSISGMVGSGLVIQNNAGDDLAITSNGAFSFNTPIDDKGVYLVTVKTQPGNPNQNCIVSNGSGSINGAPVNNVVVSCTMSSHPVKVDPSSSFAYMAMISTSGGEVLAGNIDKTTGALSSITGSPFSAGVNSNSITIDPTGKFLYVTNYTDEGSIFAFKIDPVTGVLDEVDGSPFPAGKYPSAVTIDPTGKFAYAANMSSNNISAYSIDQDTGALTAITKGDLSTGTSPTGVTIDPTGKFAYVANMSSSTISAYSIAANADLAANVDAGQLTQISGSPFTSGTYPTSITVDPTGKFAYSSNVGSSDISAYSIDQDTGALTDVTGSPFTTVAFPNSVSIVQISDTLLQFAYVSSMSLNYDNVSAYIIDTTTGILAAVSGSPFDAEIYPNPVTIAKITDDESTIYVAYISNMGSDSISAYTINPSTGVLFKASDSIATGTYPNTVTVAKVVNGTATTYFAYVSDSNNKIWTYSINTSSGALTKVGGAFPP